MKASEADRKRITNSESRNTAFSVDSYIRYVKEHIEDFDGDYEYTPMQTIQTIAIEGKRATKDIIINPIPSNYGKITWNGSVMTVS